MPTAAGPLDRRAIFEAQPSAVGKGAFIARADPKLVGDGAPGVAFSPVNIESASVIRRAQRHIGEHAPADAIARLQHDETLAIARASPRRPKARRACAHNHHIRIEQSLRPQRARQGEGRACGQNGTACER